jgi:hypothetical protein
MKEYVVKGEVLQKILTYLASKPYAEVFDIVTGIQQTSRELPGSGTAEVAVSDSGSGATGGDASASGETQQSASA